MGSIRPPACGRRGVYRCLSACLFTTDRSSRFSMTAQKFHDHFSAFANRYADFRPHYPAAIFDYLATIMPRTWLVWDCACGNGQATIDLAERFDRVIATDASKEQIASATPHPKVEYRVAPAENCGLPDRSEE